MGTFRAEEVGRDFPGLEGVVHLNSASMGVAPRSALEAVERQVRHLAEGPAGATWAEYVDAFDRPVEEARREAARLLGAAEDEVGIVTDTTAGLHHAVQSIPFRPGDNVVVSDVEYPQVALAAAGAAREDGVEVRFVRHRAGLVSLDDYRAAIDGRTRALLVSSVGWVAGQRLDLGALSDIARAGGLFLVVDAVQHLGALAVDCSGLAVDFLTAGGYKWLNAPFGSGVFYVSRAAHERGLRVRNLGLLGLEAPSGGWSEFYGSPAMEAMPPMGPARTIHRFEAQGTPNRFGAAGLAAALAYRNGLDAAAADRHLLALAGELVEALRGRGATVWTPRAEAERAGIVSFTFGGGAAEDARLHARLESRRIHVSTRYCAGVGGLRAAVHFFNTAGDVARLLEAIDEARR